MVAAQDGDTVRVADLHAHQESDCLDGVVAAIDVVAHEQVVVVRKLASDLE